MIFVKDQGTGFPVVLLHGYGEDHTLWHTLANELSSDFRVISIDLPGFGKSTALEGDFSLEAVADTVHHYICNSLKVNEYAVLGHSLGGYIALALSERYMANIAGFGLINSTSLEDSKEKKESRKKTAEFINKHGADFFLTSFVPNLFMPQNRDNLKEKIEFVLSMGYGISKNVLIGYMNAMRKRPGREHLLQKFDQVLFVAGAEDPHFSANDYQKQINLLKNKDFAKIIPSVAHMSMFEAPVSLQLTALDFLNSLKKV